MTNLAPWTLADTDDGRGPRYRQTCNPTGHSFQKSGRSTCTAPHQHLPRCLAALRCKGNEEEQDDAAMLQPHPLLEACQASGVSGGARTTRSGQCQSTPPSPPLRRNALKIIVAHAPAAALDAIGNASRHPPISAALGPQPNHSTYPARSAAQASQKQGEDTRRTMAWTKAVECHVGISDDL